MVARHVAHRESFRDFGKVDRLLTIQGLHEHADYDQGILRRHLNGTNITNETVCFWSETGDSSCRFCGGLDSIAHRLWQCPCSAELREGLPGFVLDFVPLLPRVLSEHGWTLSSPFFGQWISYLLLLPATVPPSISPVPPGGILDLFVDGSCLWQDQPRYRLASWAVVLSAPLSFHPGFGSCQVLSAQPLSGSIQTAYRAELMSLRVACCYAAEAGACARIWTDCQSVLSRFTALTQGTKSLQPNSPHADLWTGILESVADCGDGCVEVIKVPAHQPLDAAQDAFESWIFTGNSAVDAAARQANADRPPGVWALWEAHMKAVERNKQLGTWIRHHMVKVARMWMTDFEQTVQSDRQPIVRRKNLPPCVWPNEYLSSAECKSFTKIFGQKYKLVVARWMDSIWAPGGAVAWISFAQLYVLYQLQCLDSGVAIVDNQWVVMADVDGFTPEQYRFSCLCKWFRLMLQALFKSANLLVSTCTTRPRSQYLQCHIGCLAVPLRPDLHDKVEAWLSSVLSRPIRGGGIHVELPRAF